MSENGNGFYPLEMDSPLIPKKGNWFNAGKRSARALQKRFLPIDDPCKIEFEKYWESVEEFRREELRKIFPEFDDTQLNIQLHYVKNNVFDGFFEAWSMCLADTNKERVNVAGPSQVNPDRCTPEALAESAKKIKWSARKPI